MRGGYIMVDCKGLNLLAVSKQTIAGIYEETEKARKSGKQVLAHNCVWGPGVEITPIPVFAVPFDGYTVWTSSTLQIIVDEDDGVTINNMVGD